MHPDIRYNAGGENPLKEMGRRECGMIKIKRVYDMPEPGDGKRILTDQLWPRGIRKEEVRIDEGLKDIAPSETFNDEFVIK